LFDGLPQQPQRLAQVRVLPVGDERPGLLQQDPGLDGVFGPQPGGQGEQQEGC